MNEFAQQVMEAVNSRIAADKTEDVSTKDRLKAKIQEELLNEVKMLSRGDDSALRIVTNKAELGQKEFITVAYVVMPEQLEQEVFVTAVKEVIAESGLQVVDTPALAPSNSICFIIPNPYYGNGFVDVNVDLDALLEVLRVGAEKGMAYATKAYNVISEEVRHMAELKRIKNDKAIPEIDFKGAARSFLGKANQFLSAMAEKAKEQADKLSEEQA